MSPSEQFWWNWGLAAVAAVGTLSAVVVALFGSWLRAKIPILRPQLAIDLVSREGKRTKALLKSEDTSRWEDARYYHLRVSNGRRYSPVSQVQVLLLRVEVRGPDGEWRSAWDGEAPFQWSLPQAHPLLRTIGPDTPCDVCAVVKDKWVELMLVMTPKSVEHLARQRVGPETIDMIVTVQARGTEADSAPLSLQISWNGKWFDGDKEMQDNFLIKPFERNQ